MLLLNHVLNSGEVPEWDDSKAFDVLLAIPTAPKASTNPHSGGYAQSQRGGPKQPSGTGSEQKTATKQVLKMYTHKPEPINDVDRSQIELLQKDYKFKQLADKNIGEQGPKGGSVSQPEPSGEERHGRRGSDETAELKEVLDEGGNF